jgi:uncharacterized protein (DUF302 family)
MTRHAATRWAGGMATGLALLVAGAMPALAADPAPLVSYAQKAKFENVRDDLKAAIEAKGLVIDYQSNIHAMLSRTGADVGSTRRVYADAQSFVFCSAVLSRKSMEADPANVTLCPYAMVVYATAAEPDKVVVSYRRPWRPDGSRESKAALREIEALLDRMARDALGMK